MAPLEEQSPGASSRPGPPSPTSPTTAVATSSQATESHPYRTELDRSHPPLQYPSGENDSDDHRPLTELVVPGTAAPTHFGTRGRRLLRSGSAPGLLSSSHYLPSPFRHIPAGNESPLSFAVHRPGPARALVKQTVRQEVLAQPQQFSLPRFSFETRRSDISLQAEVQNSSGQLSPQRRAKGLRRKEGVLDLAKSAATVVKARSRSPPFDLTLPTEKELRTVSERSAPPSTPARRPPRQNPYPLLLQETPTSLVRRRAVSYRKNRPLIPSARRQGEQRTTTAPEERLPLIPSSPYKQHFVAPGSDFSFRNEEFSSTPIAAKLRSADRYHDLAAFEVDRTRFGDLAVPEETSRSAASSGAVTSAQDQESSATSYCNPEHPGIIVPSPASASQFGIPGSAKDYESKQFSSSPLAAFDFDFDQGEIERLSRPLQPDCETPPNTPAETHSNFSKSKLSFPTVESVPEQISEESEFVEPSLPALTPEETRRPPRGLDSAIARACRKFEPETTSGRRKVTGSHSPTPRKDVGLPRLDLPSFPRLSLGVFETGTKEAELSEVAKGKRPEQRTSSPSHHQPSEDMDFLNPESAMAMTEHRREAIRMAKSQEAAVVEKCKRSDAAAPGYTFDELIGKGSFGRVYKGHQTSSGKVVAIKVIDIDEADFRAFGDQKDEQIKDFNKEIRILRRAQESGAPNLNQMIEALPVHSQLWLICEYCPGGSVKTLMRATNDKLGERYIIVVARELSKALKGLHDAGIMHRDIKAANVLIHEEGELQLCDFGVSTVLDKKTDKRRTFIGTLHWMPPELWDKDPEYSDEVDVWAFGCTLYECAVGKPPNSDVREPQQLRSRMRRLNQSIELPENGHHSSGLRSLVSYALTPDAATRPSFTDVLAHEYLVNTEESHPTTILKELVKVYYSWLYGGGQRASLFMPGGAVAGGTPGSLTSSDEDWNFSATDSFENRMSTALNIPDFSDLSDIQTLEGESTPKAQEGTATGVLSAAEKANFEERVRRGADLSNIFDQNKPDYEYITKTDFVPIQQRRVSDLPLRAMSEERPYSIANQVIDLGDFDSSNYAAVTQAKDEKIKLADAATIRANRGNSKLYLDVPAPDPSTAKPTMSANESSTSTNDPATQDSTFPSQEWTTQRPAGEEAEPAQPSKPRDPSKHNTRDWTFASAMSEAQQDEAADTTTTTTTTTKDGAKEAEEGDHAKAKKHSTRDWSFASAMAEASASTSPPSPPSSPPSPPPPPPQRQQQQPTPHRAPPLLRSITEPLGPARPSTSDSDPSSTTTTTAADEADPFALDDNDSSLQPPSIQQALDERGISSFYGRAGGGVLASEAGRSAEVATEEGAGAGAGAGVTIPAIRGVDARVLEAEAAAAAAAGEAELSRLLGELQGCLGAAGEAVAIVGRTRTRTRTRMRGAAERRGGGESEWEDDEEEE